jgi:hypothetical protein
MVVQPGRQRMPPRKHPVPIRRQRGSDRGVGEPQQGEVVQPMSEHVSYPNKRIVTLRVTSAMAEHYGFDREARWRTRQSFRRLQDNDVAQYQRRVVRLVPPRRGVHD